MMLDKGKISDFQFKILFIGYILGSSLLTSVSEYKCMPNTWIVIIVALIIGIPIVLVFSTLAKKFKTLNILDINNLVFGKYLGSVINFMYFTYLLILTSLNIRFFGDFFVSMIMPETPLIIFGVMIVFVCGYAIKKGIAVIARPVFVLVIITILIELITVFLLSGEIKISNFLPVLDIKLEDFIISVVFLSFALFGETIIFMFIFPHINENSSRYKCTFIPLIIGASVIELITIRNIGVLGKGGESFTYPSFETIKIISIGKILTRLELMLFVIIIFSNFIKLVLLYYSLCISTAKILKLNSYKHIVYPLGIIAICISQILFEYYGEQMNFGLFLYPLIAFPIHFVIPLICLIISKIRKL